MDTTSLLNKQIPIGLVLVFLQNWLKQQKWFPLIDYNTPKMNHLFSIVLTGLATLGIHFTWSSADHSLLITGLSLATITHGAYSWLVQYIITKTGYTALASQLNPTTTTTVEEPSNDEPPNAKVQNDPYRVT